MKPCRRCGSEKICPSKIKKCDWICNRCNKGRGPTSGLPHRAPIEFTGYQKFQIRNLYTVGRSLIEIGKMFEVSPGTIRKRLVGWGYSIRGPRKDQLKERGTMKNGYRYIYVRPEEPFFSEITKNGRKYVAEHRYVMAKHIGRLLERWEIVHHINHIRDDNRIENLELIARAVEHNAETIAHTEFMRMKNRIIELEKQLESHQ